MAEIKDVVVDELRGSIIVQTQYTLNGEVVQNGQTRYLETSKETEADLIQMIKDDIAIHCENLIRRIEENRTFFNSEKLKQQKSLTAPIIASLKGKIIGVKETKTEAIDEFKGKKIKVTYDQKNTITESVLTP